MTASSGRRLPASERAATQQAGELIDRLHRLRILLPAMARDTALARREATQLRSENARLARRVAELEDLLVVHLPAKTRSLT